ncbi:hypothetical protein D3C87_1931020 [compost metagenome]
MPASEVTASATRLATATPATPQSSHSTHQTLNMTFSPFSKVCSSMPVSASPRPMIQPKTTKLNSTKGADQTRQPK